MHRSILFRLFSSHRELRVIPKQSLNRAYRFSEVKSIYESSKSHTLKESSQYYYALIRLRLSNPFTKKLQEVPILSKKDPNNSKLKDLISYCQILFLSYIVYRVYTHEQIKSADLSKVTTTFNDVQGISECKAELEEIVSMIKNHSKYSEMGAKMPHGILLTGKPGTGKTLLAKAIAGEAGVKFLSCSGSEFDEMIVGVGARKVRDLFALSKSNAPAIIFIDEIDAIGGTRRGKFGPGLNRQTLNQLLVEMDGFDPRDNVVVIAATNIPERLDDALTRPGRFDKTVHVPLPDLKGREEICELYLRKITKDESVDGKQLAKETTGMTGADLANLINTAMLCAIKDGRVVCTKQDIEMAKERIQLGIPNKSVIMTDKQKYSLAVNIVGSVLTILFTDGAEPLSKSSILVRGENFGSISQVPEKDLLNYNKKKAMAKLDILVSGKVMQDLILPLDEITDQVSRQLREANAYANQFVMSGLFKELFGLIYVDDKTKAGQAVQDKIDSAVRILLQQSYDRVLEKLKDKIELAKELAREMMEKETMSREEIDEVLRRYYQKATN